VGKIESVLGGNEVHGSLYINSSYHAVLGIRYKAGAGRIMQMLDARKHAGIQWRIYWRSFCFYAKLNTVM